MNITQLLLSEGSIQVELFAACRGMVLRPTRTSILESRRISEFNPRGVLTGATTVRIGLFGGSLSLMIFIFGKTLRPKSDY